MPTRSHVNTSGEAFLVARTDFSDRRVMDELDTPAESDSCDIQRHGKPCTDGGSASLREIWYLTHGTTSVEVMKCIVKNPIEQDTTG